MKVPSDRSAHASRRRFLQTGVAAATTAALAPSGVVSAATSAAPGPSFCAFIKFVQSYGYQELAERIADAGFDGIEATVRSGGYIEPAAAPDELPRLAEALTANGLKLTVATTDILRADTPTAEPLLRTLASLGGDLYRLGFYHYDKSRDPLEQLRELNAQAIDVAAMNRELGVRGVYQNHSGAKYVGAPIWDLQHLLEGVDADELGVAFDIRHATIEGLTAWPLHYRFILPRVRVLYAKDFVLDGVKPRHAPLGSGMVDPAYYRQITASGYAGAVSVHVEYLRKESADANMRALEVDLATLRRLLAT